MEFIVEISELLQKQIIVEAKNKKEALAMAEEIYYNEQEVLMPEDLKGTTFEVIKSKKYSKNCKKL